MKRSRLKKKSTMKEFRLSRKRFNVAYIEKGKDGRYRAWMFTPFKSTLDVYGRPGGYKSIAELKKDFQNVRFKKASELLTKEGKINY